MSGIILTHGKETVNLARPEWALLFHRGVLANPETILGYLINNRKEQ